MFHVSVAQQVFICVSFDFGRQSRNASKGNIGVAGHGGVAVGNPADESAVAEGNVSVFALANG